LLSDFAAIIITSLQFRCGGLRRTERHLQEVVRELCRRGELFNDSRKILPKLRDKLGGRQWIQTLAHVFVSKIISEIAATRHLLFFSLFDALTPRAQGAAALTDNGIHLNAAGYRAAADALVDFLYGAERAAGPAGAWRTSPAAEPLRRLQAHAPAVMVTGNHDHLHGDVDNVLDLMASLGVAPLRNEARTVGRRGRRGGGAGLRVAGVDDATAGLWAGFGPNVSAALGGRAMAGGVCAAARRSAVYFR
jgi:hypothetical protein